MKYSPDLTDKIIKMLEEVPNIRHVCKKFGLNRSTYYEWMIQYPDFRKRASAALYLGREDICDLAEGNIVRGVMEGSKADGKWFLRHNSERYMSKTQAESYYKYMYNEVRFAIDENKDADYFPNLFKAYKLIKNINNEEMEKVFAIVMNSTFNNKELVDIFYSCFERWDNIEDDKEKKEEIFQYLLETFLSKN